MRYFIILIFSFGLIGCSGKRNVMQYAENQITTLASEAFYGRGYTANGLQLAENYIALEFQKLQLKPVYPSYRQKVSYPVNIIENSSLKINGDEKSFGFEYLISPQAETETFIAETFNVSHLLLDHSIGDEKDMFKLLALNKGNIPVLDFRHVNTDLNKTLYALSAYLDQEKTLYDFPAIIHIQEKLPHSIASEQDNFLIIQVKEDIPDASLIEINNQSRLEKNFTSHNLVGKISGKNSDNAIFITAHYDHLGLVNNTVFYGANDNASGMSMLLNLAKYFKHHQPNYDLYFYALTGEEAGLQGAIEAVENLPVSQNQIKFLINLDIVGTGEEGIQVVNGSIFNKEFNLLQTINSEKNLLPQIKTRGEACNSDHCPFYEKGISCFFIYTLGGNSAYHDPLDKAETLSLKAYFELFQLLTEFIQKL
ncbi:MAG: M28 family peptidase [Flavobacteriaceae bacterium]|nr:M28 family peptidase [Flavobacteriaceae bacterium]